MTGERSDWEGKGMRRRTFWLVLGALCVTTSLAASSAFAAVDARPQAKAAAGGTVIFGADQEPRTLNTFTVEGNSSWGSLVLQPAITFATKYNNKGVLLLDLMQKQTLNSTKPQVVTYQLKSAAKWSDGKQVSADDMIFTHQRIMDPKNTIASRVGFEDIQRIQKVNGKTIKATFKKPFAAWDSLWGHPALALWWRRRRGQLRPVVAQRPADRQRPVPPGQLGPRQPDDDGAEIGRAS